MNCFEIQVRGASFKIWAPTVQDAVETFMIDMDVLEIPSELATYHSDQVPMFPAECGGFQLLSKGNIKEVLMVLGSALGIVLTSYLLQLLHGAW